MGRRVSKAKLHRRLAEGSKLRIYKVVREKSKCIACATKLFHASSRHLVTSKRPVIKMNPTIIERMKAPEDTSGTPLGVQWWLQNEQKELIGPFGEHCGGKAVVASWTKEKRDAMRQDLLSRGVPSDEVEDRLEQIAMEEWREMLRVYRQAEREAKKLNIDITTMTYDEVISAISSEKERVAYEYWLKRAERMGVTVERTPCHGARLTACVPIDSTTTYKQQSIVQNLKEVKLFLDSWEEAKFSYKKKEAQAKKKAARAQFPEHAEFLDWAIEHPTNGYLQKRDFEDQLFYIESNQVYPTTLEKIEETARNATQWVPPWTKPWPGFKAHLAPQVPPQLNVPVCPQCGGQLVHKSGMSKYGRPYDFYSCDNWKPRQRGCGGTMRTKDYHAAVAKIAAHTSSGAPAVMSSPSSTPVPVDQSAGRAQRALTKAEELARELHLTANGDQNKNQNPNTFTEPEPEPSPVSLFKKRKRNAFWK